jgi:hypothetical protein
MATDNFTAANGTALATYNAQWTAAVSGWEVRDNKANATADADSYAIRNEGGYSADQSSKANITGMSSFSEYRGVCARCAGSEATFRGYVVLTDGSSGAGHTGIGKVTNGSTAVLKDVTTTFAANDQIEIRCTGTSPVTIAFYKNGVLVDSTTDNDSPYTDGAPGIYAYGNTPGLDDWEGADIAGGTTATVTPAPAALSLQGRAPTTSAFQNVRIREVLTNGSGQVVSNATDITLLVWYAARCGGAPDISLNGMTTDSNGTISWSIPTGGLGYQSPIFYVAQNAVSLSHYTAARLIPNYE